MNFEDFFEKFIDVALKIVLIEAFIALHILVVYAIYVAFQG